jgi:multicomponent Na+:H+ antiporter subunit G
MSLIDLATVLLCLAGAVFFLAGTVGILRFPDTFCRLHALTKADNLGLGFFTLGLLLQASSPAVGLKLILIWLLALLAGTNACYAIGRYTVSRSASETEEKEEDDERS